VRGRETAHNFGLWLSANLLGDEKAIRRCGDRGIEFNPRAAQSTSSNAAGGALVPQEFADTVIRLVETYGVVRQAAQVFPMTSDSAIVPIRESGLSASYTAEGAAIDESDAVWSNVTLSPKKLATLVRFSTELSEDALGVVSDMLALECGTAFALTEDTSCLIGDGTSPYGGMTGILTKCLDGNHDMSIVEAASAHDTLNEIMVADVVRLMAAVPTYAKTNAAFFCSPTALSLVFDSIKASAGGTDLNQLQNAVQPRFLGYPIYVSPLMPDDATANYNNAVMLGFGDMRAAALLGVRRDLRIMLSEHAFFANDQIGLRATMRHDFVAHSLGDSSTTKSPFCVLIGTT